MQSDQDRIFHFERKPTKKQICPKHLKQIQEMIEQVARKRDFWDQAEVCSFRLLEIMPKFMQLEQSQRKVS